MGLLPSNNPEDQISLQQRREARWIYQNKIHKIQSIRLSKTCLIDTLINNDIEHLLKEHEVLPIANFQTLETEESERLNLTEENQKCYNEAVEYIWRTKELDQFFVTIDDDFIDASARMAMKKLCDNQRSWIQAHKAVRDSDYQTLEWYKIWHQQQTKVQPVISMDASRLNSRVIALG
jgi:hypothetical protein